ncbi:MAG TPA: NTP transferase domain-containing protein [Candidatus Paceibacterota bacterium]|jgi:bifunctional UDP-N-acetylglucosamine pyrophosphorylase/glucosamine-1-phosphate N-acetyltransferase|nr:NTP transferase domain-containing protein [Candidatus Paceibacterota bacterium]
MNDKDILQNVQVVILAAGKGKRMESDLPKALTPLFGKPFLRHILNTLSELGLPAKPVIVVGHKKEEVIKAIGEEYSYAHQKEQLGTGHAVMSAKDHMHPEHETVLVLSTDQPLISRETILKILEKHKSEKPAITLGTVVVPDFDDWRSAMMHFGRIVRDSSGKVIKNVEWKDATEEEKEIKEVNPALYAFDRDWLWENINKLQNHNAQGEYYLTDLIKMAFDQGKSVEAVPVYDIIEGLQPNSKQELEILENAAP